MLRAIQVEPIIRQDRTYLITRAARVRCRIFDDISKWNNVLKTSIKGSKNELRASSRVYVLRQRLDTLERIVMRFLHPNLVIELGEINETIAKTQKILKAEKTNLSPELFERHTKALSKLCKRREEIKRVI